MPVFKIDVQKERGGLYWTNRYLMNRTTLGLASTEVDAFHFAESSIHATSVNFISLRMSDMVEGTDNFVVYPLTGSGGVSDGGSPLPGFCCLRLDMGIATGRPCRKYYRTYVGEDRSTGQNWEATYVTDSQAALTTQLSFLDVLCDPQGNPVISYLVKVPIQMRQLRRGSKRRITPVIPIA